MIETSREQVIPESQFGTGFERKFDGDATKNTNWVELTDPKKLSPYLNLPISVEISEDTYQYTGESTGDEHSLVTQTIEGVLVDVEAKGIKISIYKGVIDYSIGQENLKLGEIITVPFYHHTYELRNFAQITQISSLKAADSDLLNLC